MPTPGNCEDMQTLWKEFQEFKKFKNMQDNDKKDESDSEEEPQQEKHKHKKKTSEDNVDLRKAFDDADKMGTGNLTQFELVNALIDLKFSWNAACKIAPKLVKSPEDAISFKAFCKAYKKIAHIRRETPCDDDTTADTETECEKQDEDTTDDDDDDDDDESVRKMKKTIGDLKKRILWRKFDGGLFNVNNSYRIRLVKGGGYINVEQVTAVELFFGVSTYDHFYGCIEHGKPEEWHYRIKGNSVKRATEDVWDVYQIETKGNGKGLNK